MRTVKFRHIFGIGENSAPWENARLDDFVLMSPALGFSVHIYKVLPSLKVLNDFFSNGEANEGMSGAIEWKSFDIDTLEYEELVESICTNPKLDIKVDKKLNDIDSFSKWRRKALSVYNPRKDG